ncbi:MAG: hypothetical protein ACQCN6_00430 [Candidatus Bathyarchaeia archaeon]|jgi:hypothetical protein
MTNQGLRLLVGDNPFHGISHLSQERARVRSSEENTDCTQQATRLVELSLQNGADGFLFSVDDTTLSIIRNLNHNPIIGNAELYAIAPYAYEYVRKSTLTGGVSGLAKSLAKEMVFSSNAKVLAANLGGLLRFNLSALLKTYVAYELSRIKSASGGRLPLKSFMLHEIVTDMALALNMEGLFKSYIKFVDSYHVRPGLETRNFPYLVAKFKEWQIDFSKLTLMSSFNKVGFQMCPTKEECEDALEQVKDAEVIAMSVLAAGYLKPEDAIGYLANLDGISGLVIGVSKERQALETFRVFERGIITAKLSS